MQLPFGIQPREGTYPEFKSTSQSRLIQVTVQQVKASEDVADGPSRWSQDKGDYTMDKILFQTLLAEMRKRKIFPTVDMFASPGNHQIPNFYSMYPHWQAIEVDALKFP